MISGKAKQKYKNALNIPKLMQIVSELATLYIVNPEAGTNLNSLARRLLWV
ncbi:hypothetical protein HY634_04385 [Candidatus Uhrbacteria bacterium]|nr:hypothetical protein [Candidatus Uhrbacteria bacterium]